MGQKGFLPSACNLPLAKVPKDGPSEGGGGSQLMLGPGCLEVPQNPVYTFASVHFTQLSSAQYHLSPARTLTRSHPHGGWTLGLGPWGSQGA